jgi:hypothetical protein
MRRTPPTPASRRAILPALLAGRHGTYSDFIRVRVRLPGSGR